MVAGINTAVRLRTTIAEMKHKLAREIPVKADINIKRANFRNV